MSTGGIKLASFNLKHLIFSVWNRAILVEIYPIFAALGVGAFSGSRLVEGPGKGTLQALAMVMLLSALGLSIVYLLQNYPNFQV
ncbi:hypothetical protein [Ponticaulis sp.]|uniref:hypothetical protein n=1 Tax=Ponticaulis sp. TaxID=2020902 RepID=UPI000B71E705|nr:hypothetical protein [Ponticaulis sp.]MAJ08704.1 hypothetical protein [Ponticaulis sp.]RPG17408.1 MAG: hypothetical protein CBC85_005440 [Hyphomonadaceae bacterium TMED125]HBH89589.1 hypothetical protein [Hyphomonadaceae bacterium]